MGKKEKAAVKVVLDTNILISYLLFKGELARVVDLWKKGRIIPILSRDTFDAFKTALEYPKFSLTAQEMKVMIEEEVLPFFEVIEVADKIKGVCRTSSSIITFISCA